MKVIKVTKRLGRVKSDGNFGSYKMESEITAILEENDDLETVGQELFDACMESINKDYTRIMEKKKNG